MRWSAQKFRWLSLGGVVVLAGVLAAVLGLANYRAGKVWQRILKRNGVNLVQESNGVTYSQSLKGRTVFTLHAEKSTPRGNGVYSLHNAVLILYGKDGRDDRIDGNEFEYDQGQGILRALGEVHMDLQAPESSGGAGTAAGGAATHPSFSFAPDGGAAADPAVIHVKTSGLVYLRKLDVAATKEPVEFSYRGMRCESMGAEFDSGQSTLHLLAAVHLSGSMRDAPFTLAAARADLNRRDDTVALTRADWASGDRAARADSVLLWLRKDGSLYRAEGQGSVQMHAASRVLRAPEAQAQFGNGNRPESAIFKGGVQFADASAAEVVHASATELTLSTDAGGVLHRAVADGAVQLHAEQMAGKTVEATREMKAQHADAAFAAIAGSDTAETKEASLRSLQLQGGAEVQAASLPLKGGAEGGRGAQTEVRADSLLTTFLAVATGRSAPQRMVGQGHTVFEQRAATGARQVSTGDTLDAQFAQQPAKGPGSGRVLTEVASATQNGHVVLQAWPATSGGASSPGSGKQGLAVAGPSVGHAERAVYAGHAGTLTLTAEGGHRAEVDDDGTQIEAPEIVLHQGSGDGEASGGVAATTAGQAGSPGSAGSPATHVLAARAKLVHALQTAEFSGSDAAPAQMWQGSSQVLAARLLLDSKRHTLTARPESAGGLVHGVFATEHAGSAGPAAVGRQEGVETSSAPDAGAAETGNALARVAGTPGKTGKAEGLDGSRHFGVRPLTEERPTGPSSDAIRVAAEALDYNETDHEASFHGHVVLHGAEGTLTGERGALFLQDAAGSGKAVGASAGRAGAGQLRSLLGTAVGATQGLGGRLERFVLLGDVGLMQPGRSGKGQQLTYTAATDRFVLTGSPGVMPVVADRQQGIVTGETLVFGAADHSVVVASRPGAAGAGQVAGKGSYGRRVHTETDIKR